MGLYSRKTEFITLNRVKTENGKEEVNKARPYGATWKRLSKSVKTAVQQIIKEKLMCFLFLISEGLIP